MSLISEEKVNNAFVSAIIVSAGNSSRMGGINKQFLNICGMPVIAHSIKAFQDCNLINEIVIVTRENDIDEVNEVVKDYSFSKVVAVVVGGETRQLSVLNGIKAVSNNAEYIAIHDGARPLVTQKVIVDTLNCAIEFNAATTGVKVIDTIKIVDENENIIDTPDRAFLRAVQTPQIFNKSLYLNAVGNVPNSKDFTDDCKLIEAYGHKVKIVDGDYENIKITTPSDIEIATYYLSKKERE